ncbi:hypothetical protein D3C74_416590 [compost metagenome]
MTCKSVTLPRSFAVTSSSHGITVVNRAATIAPAQLMRASRKGESASKSVPRTIGERMCEISSAAFFAAAGWLGAETCCIKVGSLAR